MSPPPSVLHTLAAARLARLLEDAAPPDVVVMVPSAGVQIGRSVFIPDVAVVSATGVVGFPAVLAPSAVRLVVEVLSPSNRTTDLVTKRATYALAGIAHYWLVDPDVPSLTALRLRGDGYEQVASVTGEQLHTVAEPFTVTVVPAALVRPVSST